MLLLRVFLPLAFVAAASAFPSEPKHAAVSHGIYGSSGFASSIAKHGPAKVTSYNRRGPAAEYAKPSLFSGSFSAPSHVGSSNYKSEESPYPYAHESIGYAEPHHGFVDYGPQTNHYSAQSQVLSHDPSYDPAKDPVSQYSDYLPIREYSKNSVSPGNELSLYGYRK